MASPAAQAKANALNAKLEGEARTTIDDIDKLYMRPVARKSHACALKCYDDAGTTQSSEVLENCVRNCQHSHQQANAYVQNVSIRILVALATCCALICRLAFIARENLWRCIYHSREVLLSCSSNLSIQRKKFIRTTIHVAIDLFPHDNNRLSGNGNPFRYW